jgi:hypothetical protein
LIKYFIIISIIALSSCELIVIGTPPNKVEPVIINRNSSEGSVLLFKSELDTNNIQAAAEILDNEMPPLFLAIDRYDSYFDLLLLSNYLGKRSITSIDKDTIAPDNIYVELELNYTKKLKAKTFKRDSLWFIEDYSIE